MSNIRSRGFSRALSSTLLVSIVFATSPAFADNEACIDGGDCFDTIQEAVDAAWNHGILR